MSEISCFKRQKKLNYSIISSSSQERPYKTLIHHKFQKNKEEKKMIIILLTHNQDTSKKHLKIAEDSLMATTLKSKY